MEYLPTFVDQLDEDYIYHHGIKGMKWGVRRYETQSGKLTNAGKARYAGAKKKWNQEHSSGLKEKLTSDKAKKVYKNVAKGAAIAGGAALAGYAISKGVSASNDNRMRKNARKSAREYIDNDPRLQGLGSYQRKQMEDRLSDVNYSNAKRERAIKREHGQKVSLSKFDANSHMSNDSVRQLKRETDARRQEQHRRKIAREIGKREDVDILARQDLAKATAKMTDDAHEGMNRQMRDYWRRTDPDTARHLDKEDADRKKREEDQRRRNREVTKSLGSMGK